jgi:hypothetical protein
MIEEFFLPDCTGPAEQNVDCCDKAPLMACMIWGKLKFHPSAPLKRLNKRWHDLA